MGRLRGTITVTIPRDLTAWVDEQVRNRRFSSRSHAVEVALLELRQYFVDGRMWLGGPRPSPRGPG